MKIEVGTIASRLYAKGITAGKTKDGWWTQLILLPSGHYQARLPGGAKFVGQLEYDTDN